LNKIDIRYAASSFLTYRRIADDDICFSEKFPPRRSVPYENITYVKTSGELEAALREKTQRMTKGGKAALALSGGIDSAILARMMPKGSMTYTFRCVVPGIKVTDESPRAAELAKMNGLKNKVVEITWEDMEKYAPLLMKHKGAPIHSIEVQIYKAALCAKADGFDSLIFGESADCLYGGLSGLLEKDRTVGEFIDRFTFVQPYCALRDYVMVTEPYKKYEKDGIIDAHDFLQREFFKESVASYQNAAECAGIAFEAPYAETRLSGGLDLSRIRAGEGKYLIREIFTRLYEGEVIPPKTPMPRPVNEWLRDYDGPKRPEFWPHCAKNMTGDQKWLLYSLETFLNILDESD